MNKVIIAIIIAALIGGGLWFALSSDDTGTDQTMETTGQTAEEQPAQESQEEEVTSNEAQEEQQPPATVEVVYTDNGFEPRDITINLGDTVVWTNESSSAMQVASDDHPIHSDYPGFDQLSNGQSYSFTFDQTGTWGYHNHSSHTQGGTITVN